MEAVNITSRTLGIDNVNFESWLEQLNQMYSADMDTFIKALVSLEFGITDKEQLEAIYQDWLNSQFETSFLSDVIKNSAYGLGY